jgi:UDP-galactopyranose mutase
MNISAATFPAAHSRPATHVSSDAPPLPIICFSHFPWGFAWQRPQHLLTRLSEHHPVFYVEEPQVHTGYRKPELTVSHHDGVTILSPTLPHGTQGYGSANNAAVRLLLETFFNRELSGWDVVAWYYTPLAVGTLPQTLRPVATVFDEMEDLSNLRTVSKEIRDQERLLMQMADLVFCAGPSLHDARKYRHPRAFSFPSGVDVDHFRRDSPTQPDTASSATSVIGYYGVLDERIDFELVGGIADLRPDWSIVMIGPVARIFEKQLAHRPNIHYPGMRRYSELPEDLANFDAAMLPYALNQVTRSITPAKTLEYLAGGKPVVSTPITDVIELYGDVVEIASTPQEFVDAIETLRNESPPARSRREERVQAVLAEHNWDVIADRMRQLINDVISGRPTLAAMIRNAAFSSSPAYPATIPKARR